MIREFLRSNFEELKTDGGHAHFAGQRVDSMERDELLALIGWMGRESLRKDTQFQDYANMRRALSNHV